ncbi:CoA-transferase family III [Sistotremastrum suecicum HHB10207 ss-3]|uniref:CoA-transferase family III n=1 Tax=Sistotremastrum suecicum HHB10207 ss-3 TaxID=1314776 RepID=A0A166EW09_9AGAM|nr:CoA-transferase family III [Sistotremastrum suecicum HHB10207 ss-3]
MNSGVPLQGLKVIELAGLAPGPFAGLILADFGADVVRIDRTSSNAVVKDILCRGKRSIALNLKTETGRSILKRLISAADVLIDPFRPGVLEKLCLGPDVFLAPGGINPRLIFARLVGFPPGPSRDMAGHDLNYLADSGVLSMFPRGDKPSFPLNILADFAGGGMSCVMGILLAVIERQKSGLGQVVECNMVSGTRYLSSFPLLLSLAENPTFGEPGASKGLLDGGAPFYEVYRCSDGGYMSVACLEPQFFKVFMDRFSGALKLARTVEIMEAPMPLHLQNDRSRWPELRRYLEKGFLSKTRDEWTTIFEGSDACVMPMRTPAEAATAHGPVPAPHPRLSRTKLEVGSSDLSIDILEPGAHTDQILRELDITDRERAQLVADGVVTAPKQLRSRL